MGTAGEGIWDQDKFKNINGTCTDTGDQVPDGEGVDSKKEREVYQSQYGTSNNAHIHEGLEHIPK